MYHLLRVQVGTTAPPCPLQRTKIHGLKLEAGTHEDVNVSFLKVPVFLACFEEKGIRGGETPWIPNSVRTFLSASMIVAQVPNMCRFSDYGPAESTLTGKASLEEPGPIPNQDRFAKRSLSKWVTQSNFVRSDDPVELCKVTHLPSEH